MAYSYNGTEKIKKSRKMDRVEAIGRKKSEGNICQVGGHPVKDNPRRLLTTRWITRIHQNVKQKSGC